MKPSPSQLVAITEQRQEQLELNPVKLVKGEREKKIQRPFTGIHWVSLGFTRF